MDRQQRLSLYIDIGGGEFMEIIIIAALLLLLLAVRIISTQRKLAVMDEHINNTMNQIGVQLSSRFDVLTALLELTKESCAACQYQAMMDIVRSGRSIISAKSTPSEVLAQERIIAEVLDRISMAEEQYPELKGDKSYEKYRIAIDRYEKMIRTSCLIYNDSVTKLNRTIGKFPTSLIARILGFCQRDYLESGK